MVRASAGQGRSFGAAAATGILAGCLVWGIATAVGLTALLTASRLAYDTLRVAGACYLAWLGVTALIHSRRRLPRHDSHESHLHRDFLVTVSLPDREAEASGPRSRIRVEKTPPFRQAGAE